MPLSLPSLEGLTGISKSLPLNVNDIHLSSNVMFPNQHQAYQQSQEERYSQNSGFPQMEYILDPAVTAMYQQQGQAQAAAAAAAAAQQFSQQPVIPYPHSPAGSSPRSDAEHSFGSYQNSPYLTGQQALPHIDTYAQPPMSQEMLLPVDTSSQQPHYQTSPSTSTRRQSTSTSSNRHSPYHRAYRRLSDDEEDFMDEPLRPNATEQEKADYKRKQNTLAARRSRKKKLLQQHYLEDQLTTLSKEKEVWKTRAQTLRQLLVSNGIPCPDWDD